MKFELALLVFAAHNAFARPLEKRGVKLETTPTKPEPKARASPSAKSEASQPAASEAATAVDGKDRVSKGDVLSGIASSLVGAAALANIANLYKHKSSSTSTAPAATGTAPQKRETHELNKYFSDEVAEELVKRGIYSVEDLANSLL